MDIALYFANPLCLRAPKINSLFVSICSDRILGAAAQLKKQRLMVYDWRDGWDGNQIQKTRMRPTMN